LLPKRRQIVENGVDQASASIWASVLALALALDLSMFWLFRCFIPVDVLSVDVLSVDVLSLSTFSLISSFDLLSVDVLSVDVLPWSRILCHGYLCMWGKKLVSNFFFRQLSKE
jgi:hypothetical protein